jgi:hypothetical protein
LSTGGDTQDNAAAFHHDHLVDIDGENGCTHGIFHGSIQILFDALSVKDVAALGLDGVFGYIIAKSANRGFSKLVVTLEKVCVRLAFEYEVGMTSHLSHARESEWHGQHVL